MADIWHIRAGSVMSGGWHFNCSNGIKIEADTLDDLRVKVAEFYLQQQWPVVNLQDQITEQICTGRSGPNLCQKLSGEIVNGVPHHAVFVDNFAQDYINAANKIAEAGNVPLTDQHVADERAQVCRACPANQAKALCPKCVESSRRMYGLIRKGRHVSDDSGLSMCTAYRTDVQTHCLLANPGQLAPIEPVPSGCWRLR